jgi:2-methylisocitrate lyase-like PEP mutase family enzyme
MMAATDPAGLRPRLRELLARGELLTMPGGCSPLYAMMAEKAGFESFFLAGSQVSAFLYGLPDCGAIGLRDVVDHARHVAARTGIPVLVDGDTGYGNAVNVFFAVQEFVRAGVAGISIEDQEAPKKSGTLAGRRCISIDEAVGKVRAAVAARDELDPAFVVCARTDAIGSEGTSFEDAVSRCLAYANEGGADLLWLNSVKSREQLRTVCAAAPVPVLTIWGGASPRPTLEEFAELGASAVLFPTIASSAAAQAAWELFHEFRAHGDAAVEAWSAQAEASPRGRVSTADLVGTPEVRALEKRFLADAHQRDYETTFGHEPS